MQRLIINCNIMIFSETWLNPNRLQEHEGRSFFRADREAGATGKHRSGRLCIYLNQTPITVSSHFSVDLEYLIIECRLFYLPCEFKYVVVIPVYLPLDARVLSSHQTVNVWLGWADATQHFSHTDQSEFAAQATTQTPTSSSTTTPTSIPTTNTFLKYINMCVGAKQEPYSIATDDLRREICKHKHKQLTEFGHSADP